MLLVAGLTKARIADQLGVSLFILNKHYFKSGKISLRHAREMALAEARARNLLQLEREAAKGSVSAIKAVGQRLDRLAIEMLDDEARAGRRPAAKTKAPVVRAPAAARVGKKETDRAGAMEAEEALQLRFGSGRPH